MEERPARTSSTEQPNDGTSGASYHCVPPSALVEKGVGYPQPLSQHAAVETLQRERLVVIDGSFDARIIEAARGDVRNMIGRGLLRTEWVDGALHQHTSTRAATRCV